jgi:tellurite resistance protein TerA
MQLQQGEKRALADLGVANRCSVKVEFGLDGVDIAAFGLDAAKKIGDDRFVVLFSNTQAPDGAITLAPGQSSAEFTLDLDRLPATIDRIVFTATHDSRPISESRPLVVTLDGGKASFNVAEHLTSEKAAMMVEIYRHSSGWRIGTIAAGFNGGLGALIAHFGGEVADAPPAPPPPPPAPPPSPAPAPPPPPAPPAAPISLKKISLEKSNPTVSLKKTGSTFGEIVLNLNWTQGGGKRGLFGGSKNIDLDLGVLFELDDGYRGCIQALGGNFGTFHHEPWIELSGDDRTGAVTTGETIRVNGQHFDRIRKIGVFALIYDGVPNWQQTDGIVRMTIPGQPEIEVRMTEGRNDQRLCGIAVIENIGGELRMNRHMRYYPSQRFFADDIGIFLQWTAGSKD